MGIACVRLPYTRGIGQALKACGMSCIPIRTRSTSHVNAGTGHALRQICLWPALRAESFSLDSL